MAHLQGYVYSYIAHIRYIDWPRQAVLWCCIMGGILQHDNILAYLSRNACRNIMARRQDLSLRTVSNPTWRDLAPIWGSEVLGPEWLFGPHSLPRPQNGLLCPYYGPYYGPQKGPPGCTIWHGRSNMTYRLYMAGLDRLYYG